MIISKFLAVLFILSEASVYFVKPNVPAGANCLSPSTACGYLSEALTLSNDANIETPLISVLRGTVSAESATQIISHSVSIVSNSYKEKCVISFATVGDDTTVYYVGTNTKVITVSISKVTFSLTQPSHSEEGSPLTFEQSLFLVSQASCLSLTDCAFNITSSGYSVPAFTLQTSLIDAVNGKLFLTDTSFRQFTMNAEPLLQISLAASSFEMNGLCEFYSISRSNGYGAIFSVELDSTSSLNLQNAVVTEPTQSSTCSICLDIKEIPSTFIIRNIFFTTQSATDYSPSDAKNAILVYQNTNAQLLTDPSYFADIFRMAGSIENLIVYYTVFPSTSAYATELKKKSVYINSYNYQSYDECGTSDTPCKTFEEVTQLLTPNSHIFCTNVAFSSPTTITQSVCFRPDTSGYSWSHPNSQMRFSALTGDDSSLPILSIGDDDHAVSVALVWPYLSFNWAEYYSSPLFIGKNSELTLFKSSTSFSGSYYSSIISSAAGKLRLALCTFSYVTLQNCPFIDLSWAPGSLKVYDACTFQSMTRQTGNGAVFEVHVSGDDDVAEIPLERIYFDSCRCTGEDTYGSAIYIHLAARPAKISFDKSTFRSYGSTATSVGEFIFIESRVRNYLFSNPFFLSLDSPIRKPNDVVVRDFDGRLYTLDEIKPQVVIAAPDEDTPPADTSSDFLDCGSLDSPCFSLTAALWSVLFNEKNTTAFTFQAGVHPTSSTTLVFETPTRISGVSIDGVLQSSVTFAAPSKADEAGDSDETDDSDSPSAIFLSTGDQSELSFENLIIYISSPDAQPLYIPAFKAEDGASLKMTSVSIRAKEKPNAPVLTPLVVGDGQFTFTSVNISHFHTASCPLLSAPSLLTSSSKDILFTNIVRHEGSGSVIETAAWNSWPSLTINNFRFVECVCLNGNGGAVALEVSDWAQITLTGSELRTGKPRMFENCRAEKKEEEGGRVNEGEGTAEGDEQGDEQGEDAQDVGHGNALYIKVNNPGYLSFDHISFNQRGHTSGSEVFIDVVEGEFDGYSSSISNGIVFGSYLTPDKFVVRQADKTIVSFLSLPCFSSVLVDPTHEAATSESCGAADTPCDSIDAALNQRPTFIQLPPGTFAAQREYHYLYSVMIASINCDPETTILNVTDNGGEQPTTQARLEVGQNNDLVISGITLQLSGHQLRYGLIFCPNGEVSLMNMNIRQGDDDSPLTCYSSFFECNCYLYMSDVHIKNMILDNCPLFDFTSHYGQVTTYGIINHNSVTFENILRNRGNGSVFSAFFLPDTDTDYQTFTLSDMDFINCTAPEGYGGAIYMRIKEAPKTFSLTDLRFTSVPSAAALDGLAVYIQCECKDFAKNNPQEWRHIIGDNERVEDWFVITDLVEEEEEEKKTEGEEGQEPEGEGVEGGDGDAEEEEEKAKELTFQRYNMFELLPPLIVDAIADEDYTECGTEVRVPCNTLYEVFAPTAHIPHDSVTLAAQRHPAEVHPLSITRTFHIEGAEEKEDTTLAVAEVATADGAAAEAVIKFAPSSSAALPAQASTDTLEIERLTFSISSLAESSTDPTSKPLTVPLLLIGAAGGHVSFNEIDFVAANPASFVPISSALIDTRTGVVSFHLVKFDSIATATSPLLMPSVANGITFTGHNQFLHISRQRGSGSVMEVILVSNDSLSVCGALFDTCVCKCGNGGAMFINVTDEATLTLGQKAEDKDEDTDLVTRFVSCSASKAGCDVPSQPTEGRRNEDDSAYGGALYLAVESNNVTLSFGTLSFDGETSADVGNFVYLASEDSDVISNTELWENLKEAVGDSENALVVEDVSDPDNTKQYDIHSLLPEDDTTDTSSTPTSDGTEVEEEVEVEVRVVETTKPGIPTHWIIILAVLGGVVLIVVVVLILTFLFTRSRKPSDPNRIREDQEMSDVLKPDDEL